MDTNKMREQFEKWALGHFVNLFGEDILEKDFGGDYVQHNVRMTWVGWKNSREAVVVNLPSAEFGVSPEIEDDEEYEAAEAISMCEDAVLSRVRKHIEAQGLKVEVNP